MLLIVAVTLLFTATLSAQENYKPAHYYEYDGKRVDGFINTSFDIVRSFQFKKTILQEEPEKIKTWKQIAVVIEQDSFAILHNFKVESDVSNEMIDVPYGLGKVLATGKVTLYELHYISDGQGYKKPTVFGPDNRYTYRYTGPASVYVVQQRGSQRGIAVEKGIDDFIKQMTLYFKMSAPIVEKLKNKEYYYDTSPQLVRDFNTWYDNRKN